MKQIKKVLAIVSLTALCALAVHAADTRLGRDYSLTKAYEALGQQHYRAVCCGNTTGIALQ